MKLKIGNKVAFFLFSLILITINANNTEPEPLEDNRFTCLVKQINADLKYEAKDSLYHKFLPLSWIKNTEDDMAKEVEKVLTDLIGKFDGLFTSLNDKLNIPCEDQFKPKVKDLLNKNSAIVFLQRNTRSLKRRKSKKKSKRSKAFEPFEQIFKDHATVIKKGFEDLFTSEFFTTLRLSIQSFQNGSDTPPEYKNHITHFLTNVDKLRSGRVGFIDVVVNSMCKHVQLHEALAQLGKAKLSKDDCTKWKAYGSFFSNLILSFDDVSATA